jgi:hypothetical protein
LGYIYGSACLLFDKRVDFAGVSSDPVMENLFSGFTKNKNFGLLLSEEKYRLLEGK